MKTLSSGNQAMSRHEPGKKAKGWHLLRERTAWANSGRRNSKLEEQGKVAERRHR